MSLHTETPGSIEKIYESKKRGRQLRSIRKTRGLKQTEFATVIGVERSYLSRLERGKKTFTLELIDQVNKSVLKWDKRTGFDRKDILQLSKVEHTQTRSGLSGDAAVGFSSDALFEELNRVSQTIQELEDRREYVKYELDDIVSDLSRAEKRYKTVLLGIEVSVHRENTS